MLLEGGVLESKLSLEILDFKLLHLDNIRLLFEVAVLPLKLVKEHRSQ